MKSERFSLFLRDESMFLFCLGALLGVALGSVTSWVYPGTVLFALFFEAVFGYSLISYTERLEKKYCNEGVVEDD